MKISSAGERKEETHQMKKKDVKLMNFWVSPYGKRVEWALNLKGVDYEYIEEDSVFNKSSLLLEMNPVHKKVPILIHHHRPISESLIILEYIDETWTQYPLMPQQPHERALARFWAGFAEDKVLPAAFRAMCCDGDVKEAAEKSAREAIKKIEELIKGKKFFGGENIGYLDIAFGWISYWLPVWEEFGKMQIIDPQKCPDLSSWMSNFLNHPIIKGTLPPRDKMIHYFHHRKIQLASNSQAFMFKVN